MKSIIEDFYSNHENGLLLFNLPTGYGKTYSIVEYIFNNIESLKTNIIYITPLKKNIPDKELKDKMQAAGKGKLFDELVIRLDGNADWVIDNIDKIAKNIPATIKERIEYKRLKANIDEYNKKNIEWIKVSNDEETQSEEKEYLISLLDTIRKTYEIEFRNKVILPLLSHCEGAKEKLALIKHDREYHWIGELYPAVYSLDKKVFFMTFDKFLHGNTTLIEPTYSFLGNKIVKNALVFIDEFDTTKERYIQKIINDKLKYPINFLSLFSSLQSIRSPEFLPATFSKNSKSFAKYRKENKQAKTIPENLVEMKAIIDECFYLYNMQYSYKTDEGIAKYEHNFIFHDTRFHTVFDSVQNNLLIKTDGLLKKNWIGAYKSSKNTKNLFEMLSKSEGGVRYFIYGCILLANNYYELQNEKNRKGGIDFKKESAIDTLLSEFNINQGNDSYSFLFQSIMNGLYNKKSIVEFSNRGKNTIPSFYELGFRYYDFIDSPEHNEQSKILMYDFRDTAEKFMLSLCQEARVIGVSATADVDTVIGNYSLGFLKSKLEKDFYKWSDDQKLRFQKDFERLNCNYDEVNINVEPISICVEDIMKTLSELFENKYVALKYNEKFDLFFTGNNKYEKNTFIKLLIVAKKFIINSQIKSFLCFTNKLMKRNFPLYLECVKEMLKLTELKLNGDVIVKVISSESFDVKKSELKNDLAQNRKVLVLTTYQTSGVGQNYQYPLNQFDEKDVVYINNENRGNKEKDFDGIYLEKPTHLAVKHEAGMLAEQLIKSIFQMEALAENGEIAYQDIQKFIKDGFRCMVNKNHQPVRRISIYNSDSVLKSAIRVLIQAVGRMCRTNIKRKCIDILVDEDIFGTWNLNSGISSNQILNPEFEALLAAEQKFRNRMEQVEDTLIRNALIISRNMSDFIHHMLRAKWNDNNINQYKFMREISMNPTHSEEEMNYQLKQIYIKKPYNISSYSYHQEKDYRLIKQIEFSHRLPQIVNEEEASLPQLMRIKGLKEYFEAHGYATEFKPGDYILPPILFQNIYKGMLGEVAGKYLVEKHWNVTLEEITEKELFELFDFRIGDIYIDFKLWKETYQKPREQEIDKIEKKLMKCNGKRAVIINIFESEKEQSAMQTSNNGSIVEISHLVLLETCKFDFTVKAEMDRKGVFIDESHDKSN